MTKFIQPVKGKLSDQEVANMIRATAKPATDTMKACASAVKEEIRPNLGPELERLGLELSQKPARVDARILRPPQVKWSKLITIINFVLR